ncbi:MAG: hypothetical protein KF678_12530 [Phycisphaeraceae bacterium]|nr:hypothetical protein [Phycisphaeraceae bacterium]
MDDFRQTLAAHQVLTSKAIAYAPVMVAFEIVLGMALLPTSENQFAFRACLLVSLAFLIAFLLYLARVPYSTLKTVGCGCMGRWEPDSSSVAWWPFARNTVIGLLHIPAWALHSRKKP